MMKKHAVLLFLILVLAPVSAAFAAAPSLPTMAHPLVVDKAGKTVSFLAEVNGKYFYQPTRHFAVFKDGSNGDKAVLRGFVTPEAFYHALLDIGAVPGNNMTMKNKEVTHVKGSGFQVRVSWQGSSRSYSIDEAVVESNHRPITMHFGGNLATAKMKKTGCLLCFDSCPVGIVSNSQYTYGAIEKRGEVKMRGNRAVLPKDGTKVVVTLTLI